MLDELFVGLLGVLVAGVVGVEPGGSVLPDAATVGVVGVAGVDAGVVDAEKEKLLLCALDGSDVGRIVCDPLQRPWHAFTVEPDEPVPVLPFPPGRPFATGVTVTLPVVTVAPAPLVWVIGVVVGAVVLGRPCPCVIASLPALSAVPGPVVPALRLLVAPVVTGVTVTVAGPGVAVADCGVVSVRVVSVRVMLVDAGVTAAVAVVVAAGCGVVSVRVLLAAGVDGAAGAGLLAGVGLLTGAALLAGAGVLAAAALVRACAAL